MSRGFFHALVGVLAVAAIGLLVLFRPTESDRVVKRIRSLAAEASFRPGEGTVRRLARMQTLSAAFTEDAVLRFESLGLPSAVLTGREEINRIIGAALDLRGGLEIQLFDPVVTLGPESDAARVQWTITAMSGKQEAFTAQEFEFKLIKRDGVWVIRELNTLRTLRR